ncbi:MAG: dihydroxyacetone-like protein/glyceraldehyde kinaselike protein [Bacilli bacterium]|nr:dihydroxyacetone-like protein/glyceraldehyde kinaselike protein [Bacilli bacterium]
MDMLLFDMEGEIILRKRFNSIDGFDFYQMILAGSRQINENAERVNGLNVFPVPDGDTGTNMNLTMTSGLEELRKKQTDHIGYAADAFSKGLLMGARGNSGVILSQLFSGFAKSVHECKEISTQQFAAALQQGVDMAYKAVVKPVEGTILTVSKEAAKYAVVQARRTNDLEELMRDVLLQSKLALAKTPDLLPILKQVGVVDAGGQGLVHIYEGFLNVLSDENTDFAVPLPFHAPSYVKSVQSQLNNESIEYGYCTEFLIKLNAANGKETAFKEAHFRQDLSRFGDSLLVAADEDLVKVHIHAEYPGEVMNHAMKYGELINIKIENMREQHAHILENDEDSTHVKPLTSNSSSMDKIEKAYGFVVVGAGDGIAAIFRSLGVDVVLFGGQTMNPSTEDIVHAIKQAAAKTVFVFPNNSNIILTAQQAKKLYSDQEVIVIPSKTIPQGLSAMMAFQKNTDVSTNTETMMSALTKVESGQVTHAVRDSDLEGLTIKKDDFLGIHNNQIVISNHDLIDVCKALLALMMDRAGDIVTILTGKDASAKQTDELVSFIRSGYSQWEVEVCSGDQPLYPYIFSVV